MLKDYRVFVEINLDNIAKNVKNIKNSLHKNTSLMAVIKADAYGHGFLEIAKACLYSGATWLAVATAEEGLLIRQNNIFEPLLILGYIPFNKIEDLIKNDIQLTVFSFEMAENISKIAKKIKKIALIHIKIETGMQRIGFFTDNKSLKEILNINKLDNIKIIGVFSHFANSDDKDKTFAKKQFELFINFTKQLEKKGLTFLKHISNSGAILDLKDFNLDIVRAGILIYGLYPSENVKKDLKLYKAMSLKSTVSFIKEIDKDTSIGYGRTYFTNKKTKIATIPVGYADGYARAFSNKGYVIINNQLAKIVGNICMDQFMVDVSHIKNVKAGDSVILMGDSEDFSISAEDLAKLQNTINYEIICTIGKRVPRAFIKNNKIIKINQNF